MTEKEIKHIAQNIAFAKVSEPNELTFKLTLRYMIDNNIEGTINEIIAISLEADEIYENAEFVSETKEFVGIDGVCSVTITTMK